MIADDRCEYIGILLGGREGVTNRVPDNDNVALGSTVACFTLLACLLSMHALFTSTIPVKL